VLTGHSHTTPVAQVAEAAQVGRLLLVHVNPLGDADDPVRLDVARAIFADTSIAHDKMVLEF
ncbi:MAG: MBL fold metallo-hydrolase, partial [Pirellulales bacterium]